MISLLENIKLLRKRAGLTQAELAKRAGVSQSLIARIERGTVNPRLSTLIKIFKVLEEYTREELSAKDVMTSPVVTVVRDEKLEKVARIMWDNAISQVPVLDERGKIIGTVVERNVIEAFIRFGEKALECPVHRFMSEPLPMISPLTRASTITSMLSSETPAVLVVDKDKLVGIITRSDIMRVYVNWFKKRS
ncbi:MAG TPA: CBS domain-containing protein [Thermofilum sp.]|nr:CBS domain-containing protein [Thermofilum sp.]